MTLTLYFISRYVSRSIYVAREQVLWLEMFALDPGGGTPYNGLYGDAPPERGTCIVFTDFQRTKLYSFHNFSLRFILKIFLKFRKFQPRYSYKTYFFYSYKKKFITMYHPCFIFCVPRVSTLTYSVIDQFSSKWPSSSSRTII